MVALYQHAADDEDHPPPKTISIRRLGWRRSSLGDVTQEADNQLYSFAVLPPDSPPSKLAFTYEDFNIAERSRTPGDSSEVFGIVTPKYPSDSDNRMSSVINEDRWTELDRSQRQQSANELCTSPEVNTRRTDTVHADGDGPATGSQTTDPRSTCSYRGAADGEVAVADSSTSRESLLSNPIECSRSSCSSSDHQSSTTKIATSSGNEVTTVPRRPEDNRTAVVETKDVIKLESTIVNGNSYCGTEGRYVVTVDLEKGSTGVGFSIEGGRQSLDGDRPIVIKRVFTGSIYNVFNK